MRIALATMSFVIAAPFLAYGGLLICRMVRYLGDWGELDGTVEDTVYALFVSFVVGMFSVFAGWLMLNIGKRR